MPQASGSRSRKQLHLESLEPRNLLAGCDATINSNWDTYGNGVAHTGYVPGSIGTQFTGKVTWSREGYARTVIHDGLMYSFYLNKLRAVDLQTGVDLWTREFGRNEPWGVVGGDLSFDGGNLFFLGMHSRNYALLYSVNATTGETNWATQIRMQSPTRFPPVVANGMVFVQGGDYGGLYGVNQHDGSVKFFVSIIDIGNWSPAFYNGRLFTSAGKVFAERSLENGEVLWSIKIDDSAVTGGDTRTPVVVADGIAYVVRRSPDFSNTFVAIDLSTRTVLGGKGDYAPLFGPAVAKGRLYVDSLSEVSQFDARSNVIYPSYLLPSKFAYYESSNSQPIVTDDAVLKSSGLKTYIFDRTTRELLFTLPIGGEMTLANNTLLITSNTGEGIVAYSLCNSQAVTVAAPLELDETAGTVEAKVSIGKALTTNLQVQLSSANPALLKLPGSVSIPAGQTSIKFPINVIDNSDRNGVAKVQITASASNYLSSKLLINVKDDESAVASNVTDAWKEFNLGINRSGYFPGVLGTYLPMQPEWSATAGAFPLSIGSDVLFANGVALDSYTGKVLWRDESARTGINVDGELYYRSYAASSNEVLYSLDSESGAIRWASEYLPQSSPLNFSVTDRSLLVSADNGIYRVDRASGIVADQKVASGRESTIYQNSLLVSDGISIAAYNLSDFRVRWKHDPESIEFGDLTASNGRVAVNTKLGLRVYDIQTGRELWRVNGIFSGQPAMDNDSLFAIRLGMVIQFDAATGKRLRTFEAGQLLKAYQPIVTDDAIIVTSESQTYVFDRVSGQVKQLYPTGGQAYLTRNFIYLADSNGIKAYALKNLPALTLIVPEVLREGGATQLYSAKISIPKAQESALVVTFHSDLRSRLVLPDAVTIPAGQTSAEFSLTVINDNFDNIKSSGYIQATAVGFRSSVSLVSVSDDEKPVDGSIPGNWSMSRVDLAHTGYVPGTIGTLPFPVVRWRNRSIEHGKSAVASNGQIFVQAARLDKNSNRFWPLVLAFDSASGKLNWELEFEQSNTFSSLTAADGYIYVAFVLEKELNVFAIDQKTGDIRWRYNHGPIVETYVSTEIVVSDGVVLVPINKIGLLALSQASGARLYLSTISNQVPLSPAVIDGRVLIWDTRTFREIDLKTGVEVRKKEIASTTVWVLYSAPIVSDDIVILHNEFEAMALDSKTLDVRWTIRTRKLEKLVIAGGKVYASDYDLIRTFDLKTGAASEIYKIPGFQYSDLLSQLNVTDDAVVAQAVWGDTFVFSRQTKELLWTFRGDSFLMNLADDTLYLLGQKELVALSLRSANSYANVDVNQDGGVTPVDALLIVDHLNLRKSNWNTRLDVNSDGRVTPSDALLVINFLNARIGSMHGEGEYSAEPVYDRDEMKLKNLDNFFQSNFEDSLAVDWANLKHKNRLMFQR